MTYKGKGFGKIKELISLLLSLLVKNHLCKFEFLKSCL